MKPIGFILILAMGCASAQVRNQFNQQAQPYRPPPPPRPVAPITPKFNQAAKPNYGNSNITPPHLKPKPPNPSVAKNYTGLGGVPKFAPPPRLAIPQAKQLAVQTRLKDRFQKFATKLPPVKKTNFGLRSKFTMHASKTSPRRSFSLAAGKPILVADKLARLKALLARANFNAKASGKSLSQTFHRSASVSAPPPSHLEGDEHVGYKAYWKDAPNAVVMFKPTGDRVSIGGIWRKENPRGSAGSMIAGALRAQNLPKPKSIRFESIMEKQPTTRELDEGLSPDKTVLGRTLSSAVKHLGGKPGRWSSGKDQSGRYWIECEPEW